MNADGEVPDGRAGNQGTETGTPSSHEGEGWLNQLFIAIDRWSETISFGLFRLGILVFLPALVVLVSLDVALRYFFNAPLEWARDVNGLLLLVAVFTTLPHAWDRGYHIRMEVFHSRFAPRTRQLADVIASASGAIFFLLVGVQGARFVPFMMQTAETGEDLDFVLWPFMAVLSFCAFLVAARIFSNPAATEDQLRYPSVVPSVSDQQTSRSPQSDGEDR